ncbi:MAG TPA: FAD-dependent thymidylate synthase [Candidatus Kapabacteria bacterium]|nr:FAD-dependent thymidylate synthase [Candidatus Kapabacteria bacterium]
MEENKINCLDKGFVRLVDSMGNDSSIVQAARVSYGEGTKTKREDRELIRYLMRHRHTSPFEMVEFKFHVKLPIFIARQWIRHRTANVNEYSGRYSEMKDDFYIPEPEQVRIQSLYNHQARGEEQISEEKTLEIIETLENSQRKSFAEYQDFLSVNLARELARINLPLATYTEWYWKIDLHNLFHFLKLRLDATAQYEIRVYAEAICKLIKPIVPTAFEAFEDFILNSMNFSSQELNALKNAISFDKLDDESLKSIGFTNREILEFKEKIKVLQK